MGHGLLGEDDQIDHRDQWDELGQEVTPAEGGDQRHGDDVVHDSPRSGTSEDLQRHYFFSKILMNPYNACANLAA